MVRARPGIAFGDRDRRSGGEGTSGDM